MEPTTGPENNDYVIQNLCKELNHEREARKEQAEEVVTLSQQIATLHDAILGHTKQLATTSQATAAKDSSHTELSKLAPEVKKLVESILKPILDSLTTSASAIKKKESSGKATKSESYASVVGSTIPSCGTNNPIAGNGPAAMLIRRDCN